jgi:hypothetical protein
LSHPTITFSLRFMLPFQPQGAKDQIYPPRLYINMKLLFLYTIFVIESFVKILICDGSTFSKASTQRKRRADATATDFITVADIQEYLSGTTDRRISSIAMIEPNQILEEDDSKKWPKIEFSMATNVPVTAPSTSTCDNTSRSNSILSILRTITPEPELLNAVTTQGMAYEWILSEDPAAETILKKPCDNIEKVQQRYALVVLYYATSGDSWTDNARWLSSEDECKWAKVTCHADHAVINALFLCTYIPIYV